MQSSGVVFFCDASGVFFCEASRPSSAAPPVRTTHVLTCPEGPEKTTSDRNGKISIGMRDRGPGNVAECRGFRGLIIIVIAYFGGAA